MMIVLTLATDVYSQPDKLGRQRIIKRNVKFKKSFDTNQIHIQHFIDNKGLISNKYSVICEGDKEYKAICKFEELEKLMLPIKIKGFR